MYMYLLPRPYSAGTENILRGIVQGPSKVLDDIRVRVRVRVLK